jgi:hypothetical protein
MPKNQMMRLKRQMSAMNDIEFRPISIKKIKIGSRTASKSTRREKSIGFLCFFIIKLLDASFEDKAGGQGHIGLHPVKESGKASDLIVC